MEKDETTAEVTRWILPAQNGLKTGCCAENLVATHKSPGWKGERLAWLYVEEWEG